MRRAAGLHSRRIGVEAANVLLNHERVLQSLGRVNRPVGLIRSVFLVYPANDEYALSYAYPRRLEKNRWIPWPTGVILQDGALTLMVAISATDHHFLDPANNEQLRRMHDRMERIRRHVGAAQTTYAGILPGVLSASGIRTQAPEADVTAQIVDRAVRELLSKQDADTAVIVLGGAGFVGRRVVNLLRAHREVFPVDPRDPVSSWPSHLMGRPTLVVNVANREALSQHIGDLWPGTTVLNEVYPEPSREQVEALSRRGVQVFHVVGVRGRALPMFPKAYAGAIPCCAAWSSPDAVAVTRALTPFSDRADTWARTASMGHSITSASQAPQPQLKPEGLSHDMGEH